MQQFPAFDRPLRFTSWLRPQVWGGTALKHRLGKQSPDTGLFGESWELCGFGDHVSRCETSPWQGALIGDIWQKLTSSQEMFPLLIKWLDCHDVLSVQVHPNDAQAAQLLGQSRGKTESWVVLDALPDAVIYAGFRQTVTRDEVVQALNGGRIVDLLHAVHPQPGDCFHIPAGTVHAIGSGVLLAEVQQASDATFRLYDWDRRTNGVARPLQIEQSLECLNWSQGPVSPIPCQPASIAERLIVCPYYSITRHRFSAAWEPTISAAPSIWMVFEGQGTLTALVPELTMETRIGETWLIPSGCPIRWDLPVQGTLLEIRTAK